MTNSNLQRAWVKFKSRKRSYYSLWIFGILTFTSLFAEILANDEPLLVVYPNKIFAPVFLEYTEQDFGGEFESAPHYREPYMQELLAAKSKFVLWPPLRFDGRTINYNLPNSAPSPPDGVNWLGTDDQGRDLLARILYGYRISVVFAFLLTILSIPAGIFLGALQGFYGGMTDLIGQRITEIWSGMPVLFILIILASLTQPNLWWLLLITFIFSWMGLADLVRAEFLRGRNMSYITAARCMGVTDSIIMFRHILPNAMVATLSFVPFIFTAAITILTSLDFLGYGLPPGTPSFGELISQAKTNISAPWIGLAAFAVITTMLSLLIFIGEGLRDAFDPNIQ